MSRVAQQVRSESLQGLGEDDFIQALAQIVERPLTRRIVLGIGDDAAVWQPSRSHRSVITTDAVVDEVHFSRDIMSWFDVGWRAMTAGLSDLAAMGARPQLGTIALGVPPDLNVDDLRECYRGLAACAALTPLAIVGGDVVRAPSLFMSVTAVGEVRATHVKRRDGGKAGDVLAVTGPLGASRAGLLMLRNEISLDGDAREEALRAYRRPAARWREGAWLGASSNVHAMMDCSDGLSTDLGRLCLRSKLGALLADVPVAPSAEAAARARAEDATEFALSSGEDFELIVAVAPRAFTYLAKRFRAHFGRTLFRIGSLRKESGIALARGGRELPVVPTGWDSLRS